MRVPKGRGLVVVGVAVLVAAGCDLGTPAVVHPAPSRHVEVVDVNGDGALDVVAVGADTYQVLVNDGAGRLTGGSPVAVGGEVVAFDVGDLDGDGVVDRVDAQRVESGPTNLVLSRGDGVGGFGVPEVVVTDVGNQVVKDVEVGDIDGDGVGDLLVAGRYGLTTYRNDGGGAFTTHVSAGVPCVVRPDEFVFQGTAVALADRGGDGEVVMVGYCEWPWGPGPQIAVVAGGARTIHGVGALGTELVGLSLADINEDGYDDVVVAAPEVSAVAVFPGTATGDVGDPFTVATPAPPGAVEVADIDGDGHLDLVVTAAGTGLARVLYGTGTGAFPESHVVATGGDVVGPVTVGDIDGDGSFDLVFGNDVDTADSSVAVLLNTRDGRQH